MIVIFCTGAESVCRAATSAVADLMIGHDALFMIRQHGVFLLITRDDGLDALLKVRLGDGLAAVAHGAQRRPR